MFYIQFCLNFLNVGFQLRSVQLKAAESNAALHLGTGSELPAGNQWGQPPSLAAPKGRGRGADFFP